MAPEKDEHKHRHRGLGTIGLFVLLTHFYGPGTLEEMLQVSWAHLLPWIFLVGGLGLSAFLVEAYRRRRRGSTQWFIEVYAIIGALFVCDAVVENFLGPLPIFEALLGDMGVFWRLLLLAVFVLGGGFFILRRAWTAYRDLEAPA